MSRNVMLSAFLFYEGKGRVKLWIIYMIIFQKKEKKK